MKYVGYKLTRTEDERLIPVFWVFMVIVSVLMFFTSNIVIYIQKTRSTSFLDNSTNNINPIYGFNLRNFLEDN